MRYDAIIGIAFYGVWILLVIAIGVGLFKHLARSVRRPNARRAR